MTFVVALYGGRHLGMLLTHLHSIRHTHPQAQVEVYFQDTPAAQMEALQRGFPEVTFVRTHFDFASDRILRISSKTLAWEMAAQRQPEGEPVCFLDVDTLVYRPLEHFFTQYSADVIFTWRESGFELNTGVLLGRAGPVLRAFFAAWRAETMAILRDSPRLAQANDARLPYGASDQMALHQMLQFTPGQREYVREIDGHTVRFYGEHTDVLNETRSTPLTEQTHVLHFKGGWQPILLDGWPFTAHRPRAACQPMYRLYLQTFTDALTGLNQRLGTHWRARDFQVQVPRYTQAPTAARGWYALHAVAAHGRVKWDFFKRALRWAARHAGRLWPSSTP